MFFQAIPPSFRVFLKIKYNGQIILKNTLLKDEALK